MKKLILMKKINNQSIEDKNISFFSKNSKYQENINNIDTYKILYDEISYNVNNINKLLDIGHGGSFDYDTNKVKEIIGLDLDYMININYYQNEMKSAENAFLYSE